MLQTNKFLKVLKFTAGVFFLPIVLISLLLWYAYDIQFNLALKQKISKAKHEFIKFSKRYQAEKFIARELDRIYLTTDTVSKLKIKLMRFKELYKSLHVSYIIWDQKQNLCYSSEPITINERKKWNIACQLLKSISRKRRLERENISAEQEIFLKEMLGEYFIAPYFHVCHISGKWNLLHTSKKSNAPLLWLNFNHNRAGLIVKIFNKEMIRDTVLARQLSICNSHSTHINYSIVKNGLPLLKSYLAQEKTRKIQNNLHNPFKNTFTSKDNIYLWQRLGKQYKLIASIRKKNLISYRWKKLVIEIVVFSFLILLSLTYLLYKQFVSDRTNQKSIKTKLIILFSIASFLPSLLIGILGYDYLRLYKLADLSNIYLKGNLFLQHIDSLFKTEKTRQVRNIKKGGKILKRKLCNSIITPQTILNFYNLQNPKPYHFVLLGSQTPLIGSEFAILKNGKCLYKFHNRLFDKDRFTIFNKIMINLGKLFLAYINSAPLPKKELTKLELLVDTIGIKSPINLIQDIFSHINSFYSMGFGANLFPSFIDVYALHNEKVIDYVLFYIWQPNTLYLEYLRREISNINRNPYGFKVFAFIEKYERTLPSRFHKYNKLVRYAHSLNEKNGMEPTKLTYNNEQYYFFGFKCSQMENIKLIGFFPEKTINLKLKRLSYFFILFAVINFIVSLSFGLLVARNILAPLTVIKSGIKHMKNKNFDFRLPYLGNNEFGNLAKIVNETMNDFSEIETAGDFKEKVFGDISQVFDFGHYKGAAGSIDNNTFNGNYLDIFKITQSKEALLFGTIHTKGIASALNTAFIKSCSMQLEDIAQNHQLFTTQIYQLLEKTGCEDKQANLLYLTYDNTNKKFELSDEAKANTYIYLSDLNIFEPANKIIFETCKSIVILSEPLKNSFVQINANIANILAQSYSENIVKFSKNLDANILKYFTDCEIECLSYLILLNRNLVVSAN